MSSCQMRTLWVKGWATFIWRCKNYLYKKCFILLILDTESILVFICIQRKGNKTILIGCEGFLNIPLNSHKLAATSREWKKTAKKLTFISVRWREKVTLTGEWCMSSTTCLRNRNSSHTRGSVRRNSISLVVRLLARFDLFQCETCQHLKTNYLSSTEKHFSTGERND